LGFGFLSLVDLLNGIYAFEGCSSLDDNTLLNEFAIEPTGVLGAELTGEPGGEFATTRG